MFKMPVLVYGHKEVGKELKYLIAQMVITGAADKKESCESFIGAVAPTKDFPKGAEKFPEGQGVGTFVPDVRDSKLGLKMIAFALNVAMPKAA